MTLIKIFPRWCSPRWRCRTTMASRVGLEKIKHVTKQRCVMLSTTAHVAKPIFLVHLYSYSWCFFRVARRIWQSKRLNFYAWTKTAVKYEIPCQLRHISQRNQLEISLETLKHLETSRELGPWDHELCKSTKWFCFKRTLGCQARCHGPWWWTLLGWLSTRISEWKFTFTKPTTLETPPMGV